MGRREKRRRSGFQRVLNQYGVLQSIADAYDLRILHAERRRGVYRVNTSQGWKKIKLFKYSQSELEFVHGVLEHLAGKGWKRTVPLHLTADGLPYMETTEGLYYMSAWIQGEEINSEDPFHLEMAAKIIGEMHRLLTDYQAPEGCLRSFPTRWQDKYTGQAQDLERYRQQAEGARKGKFGRRFWKVADDFIRLMGISLQLLDEAGCSQLSQVPDFITVCHTSPTASNQLVGNDGKIYIIDFDNARTDLRIYDLGKMLIRHSGWDIDKAVFLIRSYQEANPLTQEEIALLPGLCAFPTKGWQVAHSFFEEGKVHMGRLEKAIGELARQEAFVKALVQISPADLCWQPEQLFQTIPYPDLMVQEGNGEAAVHSASEAAEPEIGEAGVDLDIDVDRVLPHQMMGRQLDYVPQPFYWGDEYPDFEQLEAEELRKLVERLGKLTERLETISEGAPEVEAGGGDEWAAERRGLEAEEAVVEPGEPDRGVPVMPVLVEKVEGPQDLGVDIEVWEAIGLVDLQSQEESEVRVDLADDMEHVSKRIPEERMQPGMEVPVEYAAGLELSEEKAAVFHGQDVLETVEATAEGTALQGVPMDQAGLEGTGCIPAEPFDEPAGAAVIEDVRWEEASQQFTLEEEALLDDPPVEAIAALQEETAGDEEEVICSSEELGIETAAEADEVAEVVGEGLVEDGVQWEESSSSSMHAPKSRSVVEWSRFPEPMHRRRRNRDRPV